MRLNLTIAVTRVEWSPSTSAGEATGASNDPSAPNSGPGTTAGLGISGRVISENPHVKMGAFHTLDIEANRNVRIEKEAGGWDSISLGRVEESCVPGRGAEVGAIVCGEGSSLSMYLSPTQDPTYDTARFCNILSTISAYDGCATTS